MPSSFSRRVRRYLLGATRITGDARWIVRGPVRGSTVRYNGYAISHERKKASKGAERSCHRRRNHRGLRSCGKARAGKARPPNDRPKVVHHSRLEKRHQREMAWFERRSEILVDLIERAKKRGGLRLGSREDFSLRRKIQPFRRIAIAISSIGAARSATSILKGVIQDRMELMVLPSSDFFKCDVTVRRIELPRELPGIKITHGAYTAVPPPPSLTTSSNRRRGAPRRGMRFSETPSCTCPDGGVPTIRGLCVRCSLRCSREVRRNTRAFTG
jgi:hypothetical protein